MGCICSESEKDIKSNKREENKKDLKQIKANQKKKESINKKQSANEDDDDEIMKEIEEMNNQKNEDNIKDYLNSLYKSYYEAKTYFHSNDLKEKEVDAIQKCKKIFEAKKLLNEGKQKNINMKELPCKLTSEYITGYTQEERKGKILNIINKLKQEKENVKKRMDQKIEEMQKKSKTIKKKENIEIFKIESKKNLDEDKKKIEIYNKIIGVINGLLNDEYIPVPDYIIENEEYNKEIINEDIPENVMRITVKNLTYTKSNPMIIFYIKLSDNNEMSKEIKGKSKDNINETFDWSFNDLKSILRNKIDIALLRTYAIKSNKLKGKSEISLRNFMNNSKIDEAYKIKMESGKEDNYIDVTIKIRSAIVQKEYETAYREVIKIKKIYPKFKINGDNYVSQSQEVNKSVNKILEDFNNKNNDEKLALN